MTEDRENQAEQLLATLHRHPRIAYQGFAESAEQLAALRQSLPPLVPFPGGHYFGLLAILDWDHRLPSQLVMLRVYGYYSEATFRAAQAEYEARQEQILRRDKFPEFDVPDFVGIIADEAYEGEVALDGRVAKLRLVSGWRRDIERAVAQLAVTRVRQSDEFQQLCTDGTSRPEYLGDLEAVSWTPPCESGHPRWSVDVWYLTDLNDAMGRGRSFLVDPSDQQLLAVREFVVRSA